MMSPHICIWDLKARDTPFGKRINGSKGYIGSLGRPTDYTSAEVYQAGDLDGWCVSEWENVPDGLWRARKTDDDVFHTFVQLHNLDFRNTPFEHRSKLCCVSKREWWKMYTDYEALAEMEGLVWGPVTAFVPFITPNPQGYLGVWGDFGESLKLFPPSLYVYDAFESGTHLLEVQ